MVFSNPQQLDSQKGNETEPITFNIEWHPAPLEIFRKIVVNLLLSQNHFSNPYNCRIS